MSTRPQTSDDPKTKKKSRKKSAKRQAGPAAEKRLSRNRKPENMSLEEWQTLLRRQHGREQDYRYKNVGDDPLFSEFRVTNPESGSVYKVAIRGAEPGNNFCACPDFATNNLGTCKHIEFVLAQLERKRGATAALRAGFQPSYSEVYLQYGAKRTVVFRPGTECPVEISRLAGKYFDAEGELQPTGFRKFDRFIAQAREFEHDLRCYDDVLNFIAEVRDTEIRGKRIGKAFAGGIRSKAFNDLLRVPLYNYQRQGALFAAKAGRCLIGDEMGLGKTIQAIAAAEIMAREYGVERVLIVCPTSLKHQWEREISRFTERSVHVISGALHQRHKQFTGDAFFTITNYDTVYRDLAAIEKMDPDLVILDEAQRIKNWKTRTAQTVKKIQSPYCIVLTGTPLENRLEELVSLVEYVDRYRLGPTYQFLNDHQIQDENGRVVGYQNLDGVGKTLEPILLRRQKSEVLSQLPQRLEKNFFVSMTPQQSEHHEENRVIVGRIIHKWRNYRYLSESDQRRLMIALQRMRMACDGTYLLDEETDFSVKPDELVILLEECLEDPKTKVVIFSQWLRMHELIVRRLEARGWGHVVFHGGVDSRKRKGLIDQFREDPECRIFLSTDAGGVGLNLQHANVVMNMDLPWNPAVLEQRIGRVHRLGQTQPVRVINFVAERSIEEGMLSILAFKQSLFSGILDGGQKEVFLGESRLNRFMKTVEAATETIPDAGPGSNANDQTDDNVDDSYDKKPARNAGDLNGDSSDSTETDQTDVTEVETDQSETDQTATGHETVVSANGDTEAVTPSSNGDASQTQTPADPLTGLLQNGMALLQQLSAASRTQPDGPRAKPTQKLLFDTGHDEKTGETYLKVPMPDPELLQQAVNAFSSLLQGLHR